MAADFVTHLTSRVGALPRMALQLVLQVCNARQQGVGLGSPALVHLLHTLLPSLQSPASNVHVLLCQKKILH